MKISSCKLHEVLSCDEETNIVEVAKKLRIKRERHLIVTDKGKPIGIISTTDISNRVVAEGKDPKKVKAKEVMTAKIISKDINEPITQAYIEMVRENLVSCPITEKGKLKGILDIREIMNVLSKSSAKK